MLKNLLIITVICVVLVNCTKQKNTTFKVGIIADCQYCDCDIKWNRYYKKAPQRLKIAIDNFNKDTLDYSIHLGDFIDKDIKSLDSVLPIWQQLNSNAYHVLGNHDLEVKDQHKKSVLKQLKLEKRYYSFTKNNWRFIVLDGNDLSFYGSLTPEKVHQRDSLFNQLKYKNLPFVKKWNGGLSHIQLRWIQQELELAKTHNQLVGFYSHFPIYPIDQHTIWNRKQFTELIAPYTNVKFYFNGHNHEGAYKKVNNVHYVTFKGMVDTKNTTAFAKATFTKDSIYIAGFGREPSRTLLLN